VRLAEKERQAGALGRKVICPRCGAETFEHLQSYPRCPRCHEYLRKCRYCSHFDFQVYGCTVLELLEDFRRQPHVDEANACPYYDTTLAVGLLRGPGWRHVALRISLAVLPAVLVILAMFAFIPRPAREGTPRLLLKAHIPDYTTMGETLAFQLIINNAEQTPAGEVRLVVGEAFLRDFREITLDPPPLSVTRMRKGAAYEYGPLEGDETLTIEIRARPRKPGIFRFEARVMGGTNIEEAAVSTAVEVLP